MREHLAAVGADTIAAELVRDRDSLLHFGRAHRFPFIVKPVDAAASLGVTLVAGESDIERVWRGIAELVYAAYGIDLEAYTVAWPAKVWPALTERPAAKAAAATRFLISPPGTVTRIQGVAEVRALDCVLDVDIALSVGDTVRPLRASWDRVGQILVTGADTDAAVLAADQLAEKITIVTESRDDPRHRVTC
ncbi:MAG: hypothetical protein ACRDQX_08730 [Pseudonocardiaceae bacterium]